MDHTVTQAGPPPAPGAVKTPTPSLPATAKAEPGPLWRLLEFCASLRITVVLFVLSFILVFYGTWAQKEQGIWTVVNEYFRTDVVWIRLRVLFFFLGDIPPNLAIPYPGGWLLGGLLLINLLAAHAVRFRISWKRSGILMIHAGLILMMLGELITGLFAIEGRMTIAEGYSSNFVDDERRSELAIVRRLNAAQDEEVIIPGSKLAQGGLIQTSDLPFAIEVVKFMMNSDLHKPRDGDTNPATAGIGLKQIAVEKGETVGVDPNQQIEVPAAYITLRKKDGTPLGTHLVSTYFTLLNYKPDVVEVDGTRYALSLRAKRSYRDYTIYLKEFHHKVYPGTKIPKDYRSVVHLSDDKGEDQWVDIYMNHPLRHRGETFYQAGLHPLTKGTVLQVVRNPGWTLPYISTTVVTLGLLIHFGLMLTEFLRRRLT